MTAFADRVREKSIEVWGERRKIEMVGTAPAFVQGQRRLARVARCLRPVLVTGETGVGKELFARALHLLGPRSEQPFFAVNCALYQDSSLLISELFGHRKGSFTGAHSDRPGLFKRAHGGTIFLDEVGEMSLKVQAMLLRALSEGEIQPLGTDETQTVDVRIIAATNRDLAAMAHRRRFREDLYYRLGYIRLHIPPLRDRGSDGLHIATWMLDALNSEHDTKKQLSEKAKRVLLRYHWPGNVREMKAVVEAGYYVSEGSTIKATDLQVGPSRFGVVPSGEPSARVAGDDEPQASGDSSSLMSQPPFLSESRREARSGSGRRFGSPPPTLEDDESTRALPVSNPGWKPVESEAQRYFRRVVDGEVTFWESVRDDFISRDLNRRQVQQIIRQGLEATEGSYKKLVRLFGCSEDEYTRFMDFLRHHKLKPSRKTMQKIRRGEHVAE